MSRYWDVVNTFREVYGLSLSDARVAYRYIRDLVGAPLDVEVFDVLADEIEQYVGSPVLAEEQERYKLDLKFPGGDAWLEPDIEWEITWSYDERR